MATMPRTRVTLRDVADKAGVSLSTASRAARGHAAVDDATRERVLAAVAALGYRPDAAARSIRTGQSLAVGFVVSDVSNPLFSVIARAAEVVLREHGYALALVNSDNDPEREADALDMLGARRVDGVLVSVADETSRATRTRLRDVPAVVLDRELGLSRVDEVCSDHAQGIAEALTHLRSLGHRRVALVAGSTVQYGSRARIEAFRATASRLRLSTDRRLVRVEHHSAEAGYAATCDLLDLAEPPTALLAGNNQILRGALAALHERDVDIPGELSLVSCDDVDICELHRPPIDVIARDLDDLGAQAAHMLLARLASPGRRAQRLSLPVHFRRRASTAEPPTR